MNATRTTLITGLSLALPLLAATGMSQAQSTATPPTPQPTTTAGPVPVYRPQLRGAPETRVGGASRGTQDTGLVLSVLAPESTGLTSRDKPTVYWYSSKALSAPLEFTLSDEQAIKPLVELKVSAAQPGIHAQRLDYVLKPDVEYQWTIAAVADPSQRAGDTISGGSIKRSQPSPALAAKLKAADKAQWPFLYAEEGFWYDALAVLSEQIDAHPADRRLREQRAALLEQVGLKTAADQDRQAKP